MRILIAEDHDLILEGLKVVLRRLGADVTIRTCADFADSLAAAKEDDFDLVLLDRDLPGMNGIASGRGSCRPGAPSRGLGGDPLWRHGLCAQDPRG